MTAYNSGHTEMKRTDQDTEMLFALLRTGLWGQPADAVWRCLQAGACWETVLSMAERQTVAGIAWLGVRSLPEETEPPFDILVRWAAKADAIERRNRKMCIALGELYSLFRANGILPVLQKGHDVASMYGHPLLRECGDIDFYFMSSEERAAASALVAECGCRVTRASDGSDCYVWNGMPVEHHRRLLDLYSPFRKGLAGCLEAEYGFEDKVVGGPDAACPAVMVRVPAPMLKLLMLNLHILKHAVGRGIGLRQVCDMAMACFCLHDRIDAREAESAVRRAGIWKWSGLLHFFMVDSLGLDREVLPYRHMDGSKNGALLKRIMDGGNFGQFAGDGMPDGDVPVLRRKLGTAAAFLRNSVFSLSVAPEEALSVFLDLLSGQKRCAD